MKVAIIDADLIGRYQHRFPNLVCMKISGWHKMNGDSVILKTDYACLEEYDKVYIAKVFLDTVIPDGGILELPNIEYGGTGFFYDKAKPLPTEIEHHMPDYHLYDNWLAKVDKGGKKFKAYKDYSIGFLTRGCFRHCPFCVNRRSSKVSAHSPLNEFLDDTRKKILLLDDNFLGYKDCVKLLTELINTGKSFCFKQGLDVRLLDTEKAEMLFSAKYDGKFLFAFDNLGEAQLIEEKLQMISRYLKKDEARFYVLCGYDYSGKYDVEFWKSDLKNTCKRLKMLKQYQCLAYIMRHEKYQESPYAKLYNDLAAYANQPQFFSKMQFTDFIRRRHKKVEASAFTLEEFLSEK